MVELAFEERQRLAEEFYPQVVKLAVNMSHHVPRGVDESDLVSLADEVTIDCRDNYSFDDPSKFKNYLFRSLRNRVIDFLRGKKSRAGITKKGNYYPTISLEDVSTDVDRFTETKSYEPVDFREPTIGLEIEVKEEFDLIRRRIGNDNLFLPFCLHYSQNLEYEEIAEILKLTPKVAQNRVIAAKKSIDLWLSGHKDLEDFYARRSLASAE